MSAEVGGEGVVTSVDVDLEQLIRLSLSFDPLKLLLAQLVRRADATDKRVRDALGDGSGCVEREREGEAQGAITLWAGRGGAAGHVARARRRDWGGCGRRSG
jgi:hypothetical protein